MEILIIGLAIAGMALVLEAPARAVTPPISTDPAEIIAADAQQLDAALGQAVTNILDDSIAAVTGGLVTVDSAMILASAAESLAESVIPEIATPSGTFTISGKNLPFWEDIGIKIAVMSGLPILDPTGIDPTDTENWRLYMEELIRFSESIGLSRETPPTQTPQIIFQLTNHFRTYTYRRA